MKTDKVRVAIDIMDQIWMLEKIDEDSILPILKKFESDIRAEKQETRIKELTSMGEFKTMGEASEYCRLHGIDSTKVQLAVFTIAGALMDARKDQDKITRHTCADSVLSVIEIEHSNQIWITRDGVLASIMNTKAV